MMAFYLLQNIVSSIAIAYFCKTIGSLPHCLIDKLINELLISRKYL